MRRPEMTQSEFAAIESFLTEKIAHANSALDKLQSVPKAARPDWFDNAIKYWRNARGALTWALGSARQRARIGR